MNTTQDHLEGELVGAYVLDALEPAERTAFEAHLALCPDCQAEVAELLPVVDVLPLAVDQVQPPPEIKTRLLDAIASEGAPSVERQRPQLTALPGGAAVERRQPLFRRSEALVGLAAAVVIAGLGVWNVKLQSQIDSQKQSVAYEQGITQALLTGASVSQLAPTRSGSGAQAALVQPKNGASPYLLMGNMPATPSGKVYELWYIRGTTPYPISTFSYAGSGTAVVPVSTPATSYGVAAITLEKGPHGAKKPTTKPLVAGKLGA